MSEKDKIIPTRCLCLCFCVCVTNSGIGKVEEILENSGESKLMYMIKSLGEKCESCEELLSEKLWSKCKV